MLRSLRKEREKLQDMQKNKSSVKRAAILGGITFGSIQGISIILEMLIPKYWHVISTIFAVIGGFIMYYILKKVEKN